MLIIVAAFSIVAVVFMAFVVDIGNQRQDRRQLTTATDASALDVAERWASNSLTPLTDFTTISAGIYDCTTDAREFLDRNREVDAGDYSCRAEVRTSGLASVTVFASGTTEYRIGSAVGVNEGSIGSTTSVRITAAEGGGVRPFALCATHPAVHAWYSSADASDPSTVDRIEVAADKFLPAACGKNNGNWGFVEFETQGNGASALADTIENGTDDEVSSYFDPVNEDHLDRCNSEYEEQWDAYGEVTCLFEVTGAGGWNNANTADAFNALIGPPAITFTLPIYDKIVDLGGGSKTGFPIVAFAEVRLVSYVQGGSKDNSVTLDFVQASPTPVGTITATNHVIEICDVGSTTGAILTSLDTTCHLPGSSGGTPPPVGPPAEPCEIDSVSPAAQTVPVDASGRLTSPAGVTVSVDDSSNCGDMTLQAVSGATVVPAPGLVESGNDYDFTFPTATPLGPAGSTFVLEVLEGGTIRDDSSSLTTDATVQCSASPPVVDPATPARAPQNRNHLSDDLTSDLTVTTQLADPSSCNDLRVRIVHGAKTVEETPAVPLGSTVSVTFDAEAENPSWGWKWDAGAYEVQVLRNGVPIPGAVTTFTLSS